MSKLTKIMDLILENSSTYSEVIPPVLSGIDMSLFIDKLHSIKEDKVYRKNNFHGLHHSQKVLLFSYILGKREKLNDIDLKILTDAAIYHDMGRDNDNEDTIHGYASSLLISKVVTDSIYKDQINVNLLEAIVDMHSTPDYKIDVIFGNHDLPIEEYNRYEKLAKLLKDADALDRLRFGKKSAASLKTKFLRFSSSRRLINFAEAINHAYYEEISSLNNETIKSQIENEFHECFHSIGFDFFKINSILENGILSRSLMKEKNLKVPRNFTGGNLENWISVVDARMVKKEHQAFDEFTQNGISFFCVADKLFNPLDSLAEAIETGLPYNKSKYSDEKYVYESIPKEKIIYLIIPKQYIGADIRTLTYLYNTLNKDMLLQRIEYYIKNTGFSPSDIDFPPFLEAIEEYCEKLELYNGQNEFIISKVDDRLFNILNNLLSVINQGIQKMIYQYYCNCLNKVNGESITVLEIVNYNLELKKESYRLISIDEEAIFEINDISKMYANIKGK